MPDDAARQAHAVVYWLEHHNGDYVADGAPQPGLLQTQVVHWLLRQEWPSSISYSLHASFDAARGTVDVWLAPS